MNALGYDPKKSLTNMDKHGIDFREALFLWLDPGMIEVPVVTTDELRSLVIGRIDGKHWTAVATKREERIRVVISVRRSRKKEVILCEEHNRAGI